VAASLGGRIVLWEAESGKQIKTFPTRKGDALHSIYFSPDSKSLVVATWEPLVMLLDWQTGDQRRIALPRRKIGQDSTYHTHLSPDGRWLVGGGGFGETLCVLDAATGREAYRLHCNALTSAASPDSKTLAVCARDTKDKGETVILLHELATGMEVARFPQGHEYGYFSLAFSPDGKSLACGFSDRSFVMDCATGRPRFTLPDRPISLDFSPDGAVLAASTGSRLRLWDAATGKERHDLPGELGSTLVAAASPDGRLLAAADWLDQSVSLWDVISGRLRTRLPLKGETRYVRDLYFSPDGRTLAAAQYKGFLQFWDVATGREQRTLQLQDPTQARGSNSAYFFHLHLSADARHVATLERLFAAGESTRLALWETATGKLLQQHSLPPGARVCAWSTEGTTVALALNDTLRLMEVETGSERFRVLGVPSAGPLTASSDDRLLAAPCAKGLVTAWETATGKEVARVAAGSVAHLALTPDGRFLVSTDEQALRVWDLATSQEHRHWALPLAGKTSWGLTFVNVLVLTPDGRRAITALADGTGLVWDLAPALGPAASPQVPEAKELEGWWADLAADDAGRAYAAIWKLTETPQASVPWLRRHLQPATPANTARVRRLIADLNDDAFTVREKAFRGLEELGDAAVPALRQTLATDPAPEVRRRIEQLLERRRGTVLSREQLRLLRAVAVLEHAATPEARRLLAELAEGLPDSRQAQEARAALARLGRQGG
jgi:WD40 repeat protein